MVNEIFVFIVTFLHTQFEAVSAMSFHFFLHVVIIFIQIFECHPPKLKIYVEGRIFRCCDTFLLRTVTFSINVNSMNMKN